MKALTTMAALALWAGSSPAMAQEDMGNVLAEHLEAKWNQAVEASQTYLGLTWMNQTAFLVLLGIVALVVVYYGIKVMKWAEHRDFVAQEEKKLRARAIAEQNMRRRGY